VKPRPATVRSVFAVWLGLAGIGVQALFPLLLAVTIVAGEHHGMAGDGPRSAIHAHHAQALPETVRHDAPAGPHSPHHPHCILCLGLQASGPLVLPAATLVPEPIAAVALDWPAVLHSAAAGRVPANYAARAPPLNG
jgi:hypothetical protein